MNARDKKLEELFRVETYGPMQALVGLDQGSIPNGSRVRKVGSLPGDTHQDGALGEVFGAFRSSEEAKAELRRRGLGEVEWVYWVAWDDRPWVPVATVDYRIEMVRT